MAHLQVCQDHHPGILVIALLLFVLGIHTVPLGLAQGQGQAAAPPGAAVFRPLPHGGQEPLDVPAGDPTLPKAVSNSAYKASAAPWGLEMTSVRTHPFHRGTVGYTMEQRSAM